MPSHFKLVNYQNCRAYPCTFCKIQESRRNVYDRIEEACGYVNPHGLYIDIFPLDNCPEGWFEKHLDTLRLGMLFCLDSHAFRSGKHDTFKGRLANIIGAILSPFNRSLKTQNDFAKCADRIYKSSQCPSSKLRVGSYKARFQHSELHLPRVAFDETLIVPFENITVPIPKGHNECLTAMYGRDYMTPPPMEKRVSEHSKADKAPWYYGPVEQ